MRNLKGRLCVAAMLAALLPVGAASAADLRPIYKAPPAVLPPPLYNWSGFYGGVNIGGSWGHQDTALTIGASAVLSNSNHINGVIGGGQIGFNWQAVGSPWVFGIETDIQASGQKADGTFFLPGGGVLLVIPPTTITYQDKLEWFGTLRGRIGYAMGYQGRWLPYITGGLAYGENKVSGSGSLAGIPVAFSGTKTDIGWTLGAGIEWAFADRWSAKLEYLYIDFGNGPTVPVVAATAITTNHLTDNIGRVGLNYRF